MSIRHPSEEIRKAVGYTSLWILIMWSAYRFLFKTMRLNEITRKGMQIKKARESMTGPLTNQRKKEIKAENKEPFK